MGVVVLQVEFEENQEVRNKVMDSHIQAEHSNQPKD
jgi:hypothetical protein